MDDLYLIGLAGAFGALVLVLIQLFRPASLPKALQATDALLRRGMLSCLWRQGAFAGSGLLLCFLILRAISGDGRLSLALLSGGLCALLTALISAWMAVRSGSRTAAAAAEGLSGAVSALLSSGLVAGFSAVGLGLGAITVWYALLRSAGLDAAGLSEMALAFGLGAALAALLLRLPGGAFTEVVALAAPTLPQDDPRNPCAPAHTVGDGVGEVQGLAAGTFAAYTCLLPASFAIGARAFPERGLDKPAVLLPLVVAGVGAIASLVGAGLMKPKEVTGQRALLTSLHRGVWVAGAMTAVVIAPIAYRLFGLWRPYWAILAGIAAGCALQFLAEFFTAERYRPARSLAQGAKSGAVLPLLDGLALGLWAVPALGSVLLCAALVGFFSLHGAFPAEDASLYQGLYGVALAGVGLLSTTALTLTISAFGPVAGSAAGCARMGGLGNEVRARLEGLDPLGDAAGAAGKVLSARAAALAALALLFCAGPFDTEAAPVLLLGTLAGCGLVCLFSAALLTGLRRASGVLSSEIRRQFRAISGIKDGSAEPDYIACIKLCARWALISSALPALLAAGIPLVLWLLTGNAALGGLAAGALAVGAALALLFDIMGSAWGGARRVVEADRRTEKGSEAHRSAVTADTFGRPLRGCIGPALAALVLLCAALAAVLTTL